LLEQARAAIESGDNDSDDRPLGEVEERELAAAEAGLAWAAAVRAERGDLALARLDYRTAAAHFSTAAQREPDPERRLAYLDRQVEALFRPGYEFGDNATLGEVIGRNRDLLAERPRKRVPLQWATTQNNLGNTLRESGELESGTRRGSCR